MKKLLAILLLVCLYLPVYGGGTMYLKGTDPFIISHGVPDSAGTAYTPADSVEITVTFQDGTESMAAAWFNNADGEAALVNSKLYFFDAWTDMNGTDSLGMYVVTARWYDGSSAALSYEETYTVIQITNNVEASTAAAVAAAADVVNIDAWDPILDNDSLIIDQSTLEDLSITTVSGDIGGLAAGAIDDVWEADTSTMSAAQGIGTVIKDATDLTIANGDPSPSGWDATDSGIVANVVWDEVLTGATHNVQNSSGKRLRAIASDVISSGTGRGAPGAITFLLASAETAADDFYNGHILKIISGTGISQERTIEDYTGATDSVTLHTGDDWTTSPANNDLYEIVGGHAVEVNHIHTDVINSDAIADDITFDSLHSRTFVISNSSGTGTGLHIESNAAHGVWIKTAGTGTTALYADASGGTNANGFKAEEDGGDGGDFVATLNLDDVAGDLDSATHADDFWTAQQKIAGDSAAAGSGADSAAVYGANAQWAADSMVLASGFVTANVTSGAVTSIVNGVYSRNISGYLDSTTNNTAGQFIVNIGINDVGQSIATVQMKLGDYSGAAGDNNNVKDDIANITVGSGSGANACSIYVKAGAVFVQGVNVRLQASGGGANYFDGTDSDGLSVFALDDGTYYGYATLTGYSQNVIPDTFTFTSDYNDTLLITKHSPAAAINPNAVTVYAYTYDMNADTLKGALLKASPRGNGPWTDSTGNIVLISEVQARSDDSGYVSIELYPTHYVTNAEGDSLKYNFEFTHPRAFRASWILKTVPDSATWKLR